MKLGRWVFIHRLVLGTGGRWSKGVQQRKAVRKGGNEGQQMRRATRLSILKKVALSRSVERWDERFTTGCNSWSVRVSAHVLRGSQFFLLWRPKRVTCSYFVRIRLRLHQILLASTVPSFRFRCNPPQYGTRYSASQRLVRSPEGFDGIPKSSSNVWPVRSVSRWCVRRPVN